MSMLPKHGDANWIQTYTGRQFWPLTPRVEDICLDDIAHALANKCRFAGHTLGFYSVAQHSVIVSELVPPEDAIWALLHDATEAYLPDVCRPIKRHLAGFAEIEDRLSEVISEAFGLQPDMPESVKHADLVALHTERRDLMAMPPIPWSTDALAEPRLATIHPQIPERAERFFIARFSELSHPVARR